MIIYVPKNGRVYVMTQILSSTIGLNDTSVSWSSMESFWWYIPRFWFDPQNVRFGLCVGRFSPFGFSAKSHSIWFVILTVYNLLPWLYMTHPFLFLTLLSPGPNSPSQNIDVYLCPLFDIWNYYGKEFKLGMWCWGRIFKCVQLN